MKVTECLYSKWKAGIWLNVHLTSNSTTIQYHSELVDTKYIYVNSISNPITESILSKNTVRKNTFILWLSIKYALWIRCRLCIQLFSILTEYCKLHKGCLIKSVLVQVLWEVPPHSSTDRQCGCCLPGRDRYIVTQILLSNFYSHQLYFRNYFR